MANTKTISILFLFLSLFYSCTNEQIQSEINESNIENNIAFDLEDILKSDTLRAITIYSPTTYFLYKGQPMGFDYELLKKLSGKLNVNLKIIVAKNMDEMIDMLNRGEGDIIAYGLTITEHRKERVAFTQPYMKIHQVLVQRRPGNWRTLNQTKMKKHLITDVTQLANKTISVRRNTSYYERLLDLSKEIGENINIDTVSGELTTDEIIGMLAKGDIKYTIADNNIALINNAYYDNIDIETAVSLSQNLAWAVRKKSPKLLKRLNRAIKKVVGSEYFNVVYRKYFKNKRAYVKRLKSDYYSEFTGELSEYDPLIKRYSKNVGFDWLLIASVIYQESQFKNKRFSWVGAGGLMQLMPATAKELGVTNIHNPTQNIRGGTRYLKRMWKKWDNIPDSIQRIKFTLASYNCGYYHVKDAQSLAKFYGKNTLKWDKGVDQFILKLSKPKYYNHKTVKYGYCRGQEPYNYVKEIFIRYEIYKDLIGLTKVDE